MVHVRSYLAISAGVLVGSALAKSCQSFDIPITVDSAELAYALPTFQDDFDVAALIDAITSRTPPTASPFSATNNVTANYTIAATVCSPKGASSNANNRTVIIATHGLNFDGS